MTAGNKNGSGSVRVLIASASAVRRAGLEALVKSSRWLRLIGSMSNPQAIFERANDLRPDIILTDLDHRSSLRLPAPFVFPVIALIDDPDPGWAAQALRFGVKAILNRDCGNEEILHAIKAAGTGLVVLNAEVTSKLAERVRTPTGTSEMPLDQLTSRELEVLGMLAEGLGNHQIADRLGLSDHTIKFHISSILDKLGASTRTEAVTTALRMGLILL
jgi:two-component system, NarL family, response regulator YdfI